MTEDEVAAELREGQHLVLTMTGLARAVGIRCPLCPACGGQPEPGLSGITWPGQAFCPDPECGVFLWNATRSARENLDGGVEVVITEQDGGQP